MLTLKTNIDQFKQKSSNKKYKVLINAGGGAFGYIITNLMSSLEQDIYKRIDVMAGTSIGGILTLLYAVNSDYKWINQLFEDGVDKIFEKKPLGGIIGPKYDNDELKKFICKVVQDYKLSDINKINQRQVSVIIPTLDYNLTQPRVFDNINLDSRCDVPLWQIGLSTAAAPTYFPAMNYFWNLSGCISLEQLANMPINNQIYLLTKQAKQYQDKQREALNDINFTNKQSTLIDGGVIENIPVITTYTSLRSELGILPQDIDMFIIGTGEDFTPSNVTAEQMNKWSCIDWLTKFLIPYVTESNESTSVYWGALMGFNSFCYYNPLKTTGAMDDPGIIPTLKKQCDEIRQDFLKELYQFLDK